MNAYIYQLPIKENACFRPLDTVLSVEKKIDLNKYKIVGYVYIPEDISKNLDSDDSCLEVCEHLYNVLNCAKPKTYGGRSLSVSDIIYVNGRYFYCDDIGFKKIWFDADGIYRG